MTVDLEIATLRLAFANATGQEHRIEPVALRAAALFADALGRQLADGHSAPASASVGAASAPAVEVDLAHSSDEAVAHAIARGWLEAVALKLQL